MVKRIAKVIDRALDARVAPSAYLIPLHSLMFGLSFMLFYSTDSVQDSILYKLGPPLGAPAWGFCVSAGVILFTAGLFFRARPLVYVTSLFMFAVWLGAAIEYLIEDYWFQFSVTAVQVVTYAYFFFANWTDRLWDYVPPPRD